MGEQVDIAARAVQALSKQVDKQFYPHFHLTPPAGWVNDPNGLIYFQGQYHAFYQHYPFSSHRGPMHWGHAVSDDLVNWQHCPVALAPDSDNDKHGVFSGSAVDDNGILTVIYTGHVKVSETDDRCVVRQAQMLATSKDGIHFEKQGTVLECPEGIEHCRDPKVWWDGEQWKMILGVSADNCGQVWIYRSPDLRNWTFDQVLLKAKPDQGWMWECPDFFPLQDKWVLLISPMGIKSKGFDYNNSAQVGYFVGHFEGERYVVDQDFTELDNGHEFYATQSFFGTSDRIALSWLSMHETPMPEKKHNWVTCFTLPRILDLKDNKLVQTPWPKLKQLRQDHSSLAGLKITDQFLQTSFNVEACEMSLKLNLMACDAERFGLVIAHNQETGEGLWLYVSNQDGRLYLDRSHLKIGPVGVRSIDLEGCETLDLTIYTDKSVCEVYVNDGEKTLTSRFYTTNMASLSFFAENGSLNVDEFHHWTMRNIWDPYFTNM